jgi:hypothetical protein
MQDLAAMAYLQGFRDHVKRKLQEAGRENGQGGTLEFSVEDVHAVFAELNQKRARAAGSHSIADAGAGGGGSSA